MNPRIVFLGVLLFSVLLLLISAPATAQHPGGADVFISAEAAHAMAVRPSTVVLHVGTSEDAFLAGHIEGARFVPLSALVIERDGVPMELPPIEVLDSLFSSIGITDHAHVLIYGDGAMGDMETLAAARAYFTLDVLGQPHLHMIDGGLMAWRDAGLPLATLSSMPTQAATVEFGAHDLRDALIATAPQIEARLGDAALLLADARPHPQYTGDEAGPDVERPGHIPGAENLYWKDFLRDDGSLKPHDDLLEMWRASGYDEGRDVMVYCRTGMQASFGYMVAKHLGLNPMMYDGSFIEWSNMTTYPVDIGP